MSLGSKIKSAKRRAVGGKRLRCRKGKSCSAACISQSKYCLVDAPTPVAGALPRAVRAIQSRKEKLGPREKRQALQKRREYVKRKVNPEFKSRESLELESRKLKNQLYDAVKRKDRKSYDEFESKLIKLETLLRRKYDERYPVSTKGGDLGERNGPH